MVLAGAYQCGMRARITWLAPALGLTPWACLLHGELRWRPSAIGPYAVGVLAALAIAVLPWVLRSRRSRWSAAALVAALPWLVGIVELALTATVRLPDVDPSYRASSVGASLSDGMDALWCGALMSQALFAGLAIAAASSSSARGRPRHIMVLVPLVAACGLLSLALRIDGALVLWMIAAPLAALLSIAVAAARGAPRAALVRGSLLALSSLAAALLAEETMRHSMHLHVLACGDIASIDGVMSSLVAEASSRLPLRRLGPWLGLLVVAACAVPWLSRGRVGRRLRRIASVALTLTAAVGAHEAAMQTASDALAEAWRSADPGFATPPLPVAPTRVPSIDLRVRVDGSARRTAAEPLVLAVESGARWEHVVRALADLGPEDRDLGFVVDPDGPSRPWRRRARSVLPYAADAYLGMRSGLVWVRYCPSAPTEEHWRGRIHADGRLSYLTYGISWRQRGAVEVDPDTAIDDVLLVVWLQSVSGAGEICIH